MLTSIMAKSMTELNRGINAIQILFNQKDMTELFTNQVSEFDYQGLNIQVIANTIYAKEEAGLAEELIKMNLASMDETRVQFLRCRRSLGADRSNR